MRIKPNQLDPIWYYEDDERIDMGIGKMRTNWWFVGATITCMAFWTGVVLLIVRWAK